jgi:hypothetical protein
MMSSRSRQVGRAKHPVLSKRRGDVSMIAQIVALDHFHAKPSIQIRSGGAPHESKPIVR